MNRKKPLSSKISNIRNPNPCLIRQQQIIDIRQPCNLTIGDIFELPTRVMEDITAVIYSRDDCLPVYYYLHGGLFLGIET